MADNRVFWLLGSALALALAIGGCPTAADDDSAADDDDTTAEDPSLLPVLEGDCGRYAFLEHSEVVLDFDGEGLNDDYDVNAHPDQGHLCERRTAGGTVRELCYECDLLGVFLIREQRSSSPDSTYCMNHAGRPTIWPADADVGATWTTEIDGRWVDCDTGALQSEVAYIEEHEVLDRRVTSVPAGEGEVLVVSTLRSDEENSETFIRWIGAGLGPIFIGESEDDPTRWLADVRMQ